MSALDNLIQTAEDRHRAVGGFLKMAEAAITDLRYNHYLHDREAGKALDKIVQAINAARPVLDRRRTQSLGRRPGGDAYFGDELDVLHKVVYAIETSLKIHQERIEADRKLDRLLPLESPDERKWRRLELARAERLPLSEKLDQELTGAIRSVVTAARGQPQLMPEPQPVALTAPAEPPATDRHEELREALLEDPDRPQAAFVKLCRIHPHTVRRTRRQLEEAGEIPYLAHRHTA